MHPNLALLLPIASLVAAVCETQCSTITSLLSSCNLPGLNTDSQLIEQNCANRNISQIPNIDSIEEGPRTCALTDYKDASCFCTTGIENIPSCKNCLEEQPGGINSSIYGVADFYDGDCNAFGYWENITLAGPTTTGTSLPIQTNAVAVPGCDVCGVIEGQLKQCNLLPLSGNLPNGLVNIQGTSYYGNLLYNRTSAECFCTLPVLRRIMSCRECVLGKHALEVLDDYTTDCHSLGYWSDNQVVNVQEVPVSSTSSTSSTAHSTATGTTPNGQPSAANGGAEFSVFLIWAIMALYGSHLLL